MSKMALKPCPFCGDDVEALYYDDENGNEYGYEGEEGVHPFIKCYGCDSEWFSDCFDGVDVLKAWNRRQEVVNRWIPVSERMPNDEDYKPSYEVSACWRRILL